MTPEVNEDKDFVAIISDVISDATPVFVLYRGDSADKDTEPPRLDRNITGAMGCNSPLRWPGRVCEGPAIPSDGPDLLEEGQRVEYWEGSELRQVRIFWKKLLLSLLQMMGKARVVSTGNVVRKDSLSGPLLTPTAVQTDQCPKW